jgi:hypothetical protein
VYSLATIVYNYTPQVYAMAATLASHIYTVLDCEVGLDCMQCWFRSHTSAGMLLVLHCYHEQKVTLLCNQLLLHHACHLISDSHALCSIFSGF